MPLPNKYKYLLKEPAPRMLLEGLKLYGIREIPGNKHNPIILGWAKTLGIENIVKDDEQAWCGLAAAIVIVNAGKPLNLRSYDILRALKYLEWGEPVDIPELGDLLIFKRKGGGHVGIYVGETKNTYCVLGGNQADTFNIMEIEKSRLEGARRYYAIGKPANVRRIFLDSSGKISQNEA